MEPVHPWEEVSSQLGPQMPQPSSGSAPFIPALCVAFQFEAGEHKEGKDISKG